MRLASRVQWAAEFGKAFAGLERLLDEQRAGPAYLRQMAIAEVVAGAIGQGTAGGYCHFHDSRDSQDAPK
jgi:hypothetical protein